MKKNYFNAALLLLFLIFTGIQGGAQPLQFEDSWGPEGYSIVSSKGNSTVLNYSIKEVNFLDLEVKGQLMKEIALPGEFLPNNEGAPNLPGSGRYLALPQGAEASIRIISSRTEVIQDIAIAPAPHIPWDNEKVPLTYEKDQSIYAQDALFPATPIMLSKPTTIRGVDAIIVGVTPFQYNPVTKELVIYTDIQFEVTHTGGNGQYGEEAYRNRFWDPILSDMLLNYEQLPKINYHERYRNAKDLTGCEYLIVSPDSNDFTAWADSVRRFRTKQGIYSQVVTLSEIGNNSASSLESYFNEAYNTWDIKPAAVLLLGDYGSNQSTQITSPTWDNYCVSDNIYADVTGNSMPDIIFARITARNANELETMIMKFINYETNPPVSENFYNHPITALGWQTERWFQICSETVGGFWKNELGKEPVRINAVYDGNPSNDPWSTATNTYTITNFFGPNGLGYIPATPGELGGWSGGNASMVNNAINSGAFMLQHRDHGYEEGWGEPSYSNGNINSLSNTDLTFIFSINCLTGKYNIYGECFAEKFHRHGYGALGLIAASEVSYSFVNDTYVWGLYDNLWPEFMPSFGSTPEPRGVLPAFGNAAGKYFLQQSGWPYNSSNKEVTYNLFHHHGDAFLTVYTEMPQELTVEHNPILISGLDKFEVTADEGALIALSHDGVLLGTATGTGAPVEISFEAQLPGIYVDLVITKQNFFRYEQSLQVIPPEGPYILEDSFTFNDENSNEQIDYDETIALNMTMKNVGIEAGNNIVVEMSTTDEFVDITNATADFGTIPAESSVTLEEAFTFKTTNNIPDQHEITFLLLATNGEETWESTISMIANAPTLRMARAQFVDATGNNNGMLDPGETGDFMVYLPNDGHSVSPDANATLTSSSPYVTINSGNFHVGSIEADEEKSAIFNISVDANTPIAEYIDFDFTLDAGAYGFTNPISKPVGLLVEDWESGDLSSFEWELMGSADWFVTEEEAFEGRYSIQSGPIEDAKNTRLALDVNVISNDSISFYLKTSSEENQDLLRFYVDTQMQGIWSGETDWTRVSFPVPQGEHTLTWIYQKSSNGSGGADAAWIDWIIMPPLLRTTVNAGADIYICEVAPVPLNGIATNYESLEWSTSGDGTFDDTGLLNATYTPGTQDVESGEVALTLTVSNGSEEKSDQTLLTINTPPNVTMGENGVICEGETITIAEVSAENYVSLLWTTSGDGTFDDETALLPTYTPGTQDIEEQEVALTLTALAHPGCEDQTGMVHYVISPIPTATIEGDQSVCQGGTAQLMVNFTGNAPWTFTLDDEEITTAEETPLMMTATPEEDLTITMLWLKDQYGCTNNEPGASHFIEVLPTPEFTLGNDTTLCHNLTLELDPGIEGVTYLWSTGETSRVITVDTTGIPIGGTKTIGLTVTSETGCTAEDEINITFKDCTGIDALENNMNISLYPNPNDGVFTLSLYSEGAQTVSIAVVSILGKEVRGEKDLLIEGSYTQHFDMKALEPGVYFLRVYNDQGIFTQRIIKQ